MLTSKRVGLVLLALLALTIGIGAAARPFIPVHREHHPELRSSLRALNNARAYLQHADRDFGGHRAKAVQLTDQAIAEVCLAIAIDKR